MRLPRFLEFLRPRFARRVDLETDGLRLRGHVRIERQARGCAPEIVYDSKNFIVDAGITAVRDLLIGVNGGGFGGSIFRMAVGDGGVPVGELYNPKPPDATWPARTDLFHEVIRQDVSVFSTPTATSMRFVAAFNSVDVDPTSFSLVGGGATPILLGSPKNVGWAEVLRSPPVPRRNWILSAASTVGFAEYRSAHPT